MHYDLGPKMATKAISKPPINFVGVCPQTPLNAACSHTHSSSSLPPLPPSQLHLQDTLHPSVSRSGV